MGGGALAHAVPVRGVPIERVERVGGDVVFVQRFGESLLLRRPLHDQDDHDVVDEHVVHKVADILAPVMGRPVEKSGVGDLRNAEPGLGLEI